MAETTSELPVGKKAKAAKATKAEEDVVFEDDDPRMLFAVPTFRDVATDMLSTDGVAFLRQGVNIPFWHEPADTWLATKSDLKNATDVALAHVLLDEFNETVTITWYPKKKSKKPTVVTENYADRIVTVLYGQNALEIHYLNFFAESKDDRNCLQTGFSALVRTVQASHLDPSVKFLKTKYLHLGNAKGEILLKDLVVALGATKKELKELLALLEHLPNVGIVKKKMVKKQELSFTIFKSLHNDLEHRADLIEIYNKVKGDAEIMTVEQFTIFLQTEQGYPAEVDPLQIEALLSANEPSPTETTRAGKVSLEGFMGYLLSKEGLAVDPHHADIYQDMSEPLSHYYIASSHNTYLTGHQLVGVASVEMYIQILLSGCRCLELDLWDGPGGEPLITHGFTLVTKIKALDVLQVIKRYAFVASQFPVILSLEDHLSPPQQELLAKYIRKLLGDHLVPSLAEANIGKTWTRVNPNLPSPLDLKFKILIKHKKRPSQEDKTEAPKPSVSAIAKSLTDEATGDPDVEPEDLVEEAMQIDVENDLEMKSLVKKGVDFSHVCRYDKTKSGKDITETISELVVHTESVTFKSFADSRALTCNQMHSFGENKAMRLCAKYGRQWLHHNVRQLSRVYPKGLRIDSSNFNPALLWNVGCQMVALNYQTADGPWLLNRAMFQRNGGTGYILKPKPMRYTKSTMNPHGTGPCHGVARVTMTITIISGQHLRRVKPQQPCAVAVETVGLPADCKTRKTPGAAGSLPLWRHKMVFDHIRLPENTFVKFTVTDLLSPAQRIIPMTSLRPGYRHVALRDERDAALELSELFIHIAFQAHLDDLVEAGTISSPIGAAPKQG